MFYGFQVIHCVPKRVSTFKKIWRVVHTKFCEETKDTKINMPKSLRIPTIIKMIFL